MGENQKYYFSICNTLVVLLIIGFSSIIMEKIAFQWAPDPLDPAQNVFSAKRAFKHWKRLAVSVPARHMSTLNYNQSYDYILSEITKYQKIAHQNGILNVSFEEQRGEIYESKNARLIQIERDARNIIVLIEKKQQGKINKHPIMISAHIDGKNRGPAAYDDAAGIAAMLELLNLLAESKSPPSRPIILLFVGVEELGLQGSSLFLKYHKCSSSQSQSDGCYFNTKNGYNSIASRYIMNASSFLNIESLGPGMPLGIMQKGNRSARAIYALKNTKGIIFGTFADDVTKLGLISSTSDAVRFRQNGFAGAELLFFGNPTKYHTSLDSITEYYNFENNDDDNEADIHDDDFNLQLYFKKIKTIIIKYWNLKPKPINHLQLLGNSLTNYAFNYKIDENYINYENEMNLSIHDEKITKDDSSAVAIGISPFALVIELSRAQSFGIITIIIFFSCILTSERIDISRTFLTIIFEILSWLLTTLILLAIGFFHHRFNSLVYAKSPLFSFNYLLFCGLFIFLFFLKLFTSPKSAFSIRNISPLFYRRAIIIFDCILSLLLFKFDTSVLFYWQLAFVALSSVLPSIIAITVGFAYIDFSLFLLFSFMTRYTSLVPGPLGDIIPLVMASITTLLVALAYMPFIARPINYPKKKNQESKKKETEIKKEITEETGTQNDVDGDENTNQQNETKVHQNGASDATTQHEAPSNQQDTTESDTSTQTDASTHHDATISSTASNDTSTQQGTDSLQQDTTSNNDISTQQPSSVLNYHIKASDRPSDRKIELKVDDVSAVKVGDVKVEKVNVGKVEVGDVKVGKVEVGKVKVGEVKVGQVKVGKVEVGEVKVGQNSETAREGSTGEPSSEYAIGREETQTDMTCEVKNNNMKYLSFMFFVSIFLLILPFFSSPPYSKERYNIQGEIAHIIDPVNGSYVSFAPCSRMRVFKGLEHYMELNGEEDNSIQTYVQFEMPLDKRDVLMRNTSSDLPDFIKKWPHFTIFVKSQENASTQTNLRNVVVLIPEENPNLIAINLVINCGNVKCLHNIHSIGNVKNTDPGHWPTWVTNKEDLEITNLESDDELGYRYNLRVMPGSQPALFNFTVSTLEKIPMKVTFTWDELTEEANKFLAEFPDFIQPFGRMRSIADTSLVNYTYI
ncbi:hypothetical protein M9Y10_042134 [Tritrichomonas musculus]|uniref:Peptidase M28 domain-containing protein n=1 Tax=Tritrichomonas musculus TaxID=1915356 RepID=A0ABR2K755_9EUKA